MILVSRITALVMSLAILGWQVLNACNAQFVHRFLIADFIVALVLIIAASWPGDRPSAIAMIAAFSATGGVFLAAMTGAILVDGYSAGRVMTGLGLLPCLVLSIGLGRWLIRSVQRPTASSSPRS